MTTSPHPPPPISLFYPQPGQTYEPWRDDYTVFALNYLDKVNDFAAQLMPSTRLQYEATVLYWRLAIQVIEQGEHNFDDFVKYIAIPMGEAYQPRAKAYYSRRSLVFPSSGSSTSLSHAELVESHLHAFLGTQDDIAPFDQHLDTDYLRRMQVRWRRGVQYEG